MFTPVQAQSYLLYGNGAIIGDTTLTLASFKDIDGNDLSMADFGTTGTGTIEPNSGSSEEQILFTGLTQNSNGTCTLTGVKSVGFVTPYTQTTGLVKSHAGNTTFVLSNTAYLYSQFASLPGTQTFTGTNTFSVSPIIPTVTSAQTNQAASVGYVNSVAISGAPKAAVNVWGVTSMSVAPVTASAPIAVGDNDPRMSYVTASESLALAGVGQGNIDNTNYYVSQKGTQIGSETFAVATGGSVAFAVSLSPTPAGYVKGERVYFQTNVASGTAPTLNKNGLGAKSIYKQVTSGTTPLAIGDMGTNQLNVAEYDGGAYQLLSPVASTVNVGFKNGESSHDVATTGAQTIAHGLGVKPKLIRITLLIASDSAFNGQSIGVYNGTTVSTIYAWMFAAFNSTSAGTSTSNIIQIFTTASAEAHATVSIDATNITLTWAKTNSPTGTFTFIWEALA